MGEPVLVALSSGLAADEVEELSDEEVRTGVLDVLEKIFGNVAKTTKLVNLQRTRWRSDPYAGGSYTFIKTGSKGRQDIYEVGRSLDETLYFAGEHCSWKYPDTVAGALVSGLFAAGTILDFEKTYDELEMPSKLEKTAAKGKPQLIKKKEKKKKWSHLIPKEEINKIGVEI